MIVIRIISANPVPCGFYFRDSSIARSAPQLASMLGGLILRKGQMASPSVPSWNQILQFLREMGQLRSMSDSAA